MKFPSNRTLAKISVYIAIGGISAVMYMKYKIEDRIRNYEYYRQAFKALRGNAGKYSVEWVFWIEVGLNLKLNSNQHNHKRPLPKTREHSTDTKTHLRLNDLTMDKRMNAFTMRTIPHKYPEFKIISSRLHLQILPSSFTNDSFIIYSVFYVKTIQNWFLRSIRILNKVACN